MEIKESIGITYCSSLTLWQLLIFFMLDVDSKEATEALRQGLIRGSSFLERLEKLTMMEVSSDDEDEVSRGFEQLSKAISKGQMNLVNVKLSDLTDYGFSKKQVKKIGFCVIRLDSHSPVVNKARHKQRHGHGASLEISDDIAYPDDEFEAYEEVDSNADTDVVIARIPGNRPVQKKFHVESEERSPASLGHSPISPARSSSQLGKKGKATTWIVESKWRLGEQIGAGSFGEVFQGMNDKGKLFAVKRLIMTGQSDLISLVDEIDLMRRLTHTNIVEYLGAKVDHEKGYIYIFQAWIPGGSVAHLLKRFGPFQVEVVRRYTRQILCGLQYLHANNIVHRDIKGGNLLVDDNGIVKLADFGCSKVNEFGETQATSTIKGTPYFMAPEVLAQNMYGRKGDIWAVGCTIIQMLTGDPPWKEKKVQGLVQLHFLLTNLEGIPPFKAEVPQTLRTCMELCFQKVPDLRPSAADLLKCEFLSEDLEDSLDIENPPAEGYLSDASEATSPENGDDNDDMDNTMTVLRKQIMMVEARGKLELSGGTGSGEGSGEDTLEEIDAIIAKRNSKQGQGHAAEPPPSRRPPTSGSSARDLGQPPPANPFAKRAASASSRAADNPGPSANNPFAKRAAAGGSDARGDDSEDDAVNNPFGKKASAAKAKSRDQAKTVEPVSPVEQPKHHAARRGSGVAHQRSESMQQGSARDSDEDTPPPPSSSGSGAADAHPRAKKGSLHDERSSRGGSSAHVSPRGGEASSGWDSMFNKLSELPPTSLRVNLRKDDAEDLPPKLSARAAKDSDQSSPVPKVTPRQEAGAVPRLSPRPDSTARTPSARRLETPTPAMQPTSSFRRVATVEEEVVVASTALPNERKEKEKETWKCEKCGHNNAFNKDEDYCSNCARTRGSAGGKDPIPAAGRPITHHSALRARSGTGGGAVSRHTPPPAAATTTATEAEKETWNCKFCGEKNIEEPDVNYCTFCAKYRPAEGGMNALRTSTARGSRYVISKR